LFTKYSKFKLSLFFIHKILQARTTLWAKLSQTENYFSLKKKYTPDWKLPLFTKYPKLKSTLVYKIPQTENYPCLQNTPNWKLTMFTKYPKLKTTIVHKIQQSESYSCLQDATNWKLPMFTKYHKLKTRSWPQNTTNRKLPLHVHKMKTTHKILGTGNYPCFQIQMRKADVVVIV
jgi:hypothetical protein